MVSKGLETVLVVECGKCGTRFQLDSSRIPDSGIRVRCSRCKHAFHLQPPAQSQAAAVDAVVEEAIEHVKRGLKLARDHDKPYLFLGRLYKATGNTGAAEKMFTRAVQIRPESVDALRELRLINMRRSKQGLIGRILRR